MAKHGRKKIIRAFHGRVFYMDTHSQASSGESVGQIELLDGAAIYSVRSLSQTADKRTKKKGRNVIQSLLSGRAELMPANRVGVCI